MKPLNFKEAKSKIWKSVLLTKVSKLSLSMIQLKFLHKEGFQSLLYKWSYRLDVHSSYNKYSIKKDKLLETATQRNLRFLILITTRESGKSTKLHSFAGLLKKCLVQQYSLKLSHLRWLPHSSIKDQQYISISPFMISHQIRTRKQANDTLMKCLTVKRKLRFSIKIT